MFQSKGEWIHNQEVPHLIRSLIYFLTQDKSPFHLDLSFHMQYEVKTAMDYSEVAFYYKIEDNFEG